MNLSTTFTTNLTATPPPTAEGFDTSASILSILPKPGCQRWLPPNHFFFQLANAFLLLSYLAPNGIYGILYLRITLMLGCGFLSLWGYLVLCSADTAIWNLAFVVINAAHASYILYTLRPIRFSPELEEVFKHVFAPLKVSRVQFKHVLSCMKEIRVFKYRESYAVEEKTKVDKLCLVLVGRFLVCQNGKPLNFVSQHQFLDSPEWYGMSTDECFQVSIFAIEESHVLVWNRDKLKLSILGDTFLQAVFDHVLGKDVVNKLMQVNEACMSNGALPNLTNPAEEKAHLLVQKTDDPAAWSGVVTRQIQGTNNLLAWRLGKICEEVDYETAV